MKCIRTKPQTEWTNMGKRARSMKLDCDKYAANIKSEQAQGWFREGYAAEDRRLTKALERALSHFADIGTEQAKRAAEEIEAVLNANQYPSS